MIRFLILKRMKRCFSIYFLKQFTSWNGNIRHWSFYRRHHVCRHSFYNGYIIGKLVQYLIVNHEAQQLFTGLLPHAFVEVLGLILFSIVSSYPFIYLYRFIKGETIELKTDPNCASIDFAAAVLLFIASLLEQYVSHVHLP